MIEEPQERSAYPVDLHYEGPKRRGELLEETTTTKRNRVDEDGENPDQPLVVVDDREREITIARVEEEALLHHAARLEMHQETYHNILQSFSGSIKNLGKDSEEQVKIRPLLIFFPLLWCIQNVTVAL